MLGKIIKIIVIIKIVIKREVLTLTVIGVRLAIRTALKLRGLSISIMGFRIAAICTIAFMFVALEQDSNFLTFLLLIYLN
jgi:hypothetical protein